MIVLCVFTEENQEYCLFLKYILGQKVKCSFEAGIICVISSENILQLQSYSQKVSSLSKFCTKNHEQHLSHTHVLVLLTVYRYAEYCFVLVKKNEISKEYLGTGF